MKKLALIAMALLIIAGCGRWTDTTKGRRIGTDYMHHETHNCNAWQVSLNGPSLATGGKIHLLVNTADSDYKVHLVKALTSSGEAYAQIWNAPNVSPVGTALTVQNRNLTAECDSKTFTAVVTHSPTIVSAGTIYNGLTTHTGAGQTKGDSRSSDEIVLRANNLYLINTVSEANSNDVTITLRAYESDDYY